MISMTVRQLRTWLELLPETAQDMPVILQRDAEGNGYSPLAVAEEALYAAENDWSGEVYELPTGGLVGAVQGGDTAGDDGDASDDTADYEVPDDAIHVVVLAPIN